MSESTSTPPAADTGSTPKGDKSSGQIPVSFAQFVVSLGSSALVHLGEIPDPGQGGVQKNLGLARHTIDLLAVLKEKTKGNLDDEEGRLLDALLFDLQKKYVEASGK